MVLTVSGYARGRGTPRLWIEIICRPGIPTRGPRRLTSSEPSSNNRRERDEEPWSGSTLPTDTRVALQPPSGCVGGDSHGARPGIGSPTIFTIQLAMRADAFS